MQLDSIDWKILSLLQGDARLSNVELAQAVGLSPSPCLNRVRALEEAGYISRYVTLLDALRVGLKVSVFIQVTLVAPGRIRTGKVRERDPCKARSHGMTIS